MTAICSHPVAANDPVPVLGHMALVGIANRLRGLRGDRDHDRIGVILADLADACLERFGREEILMMASRYPRIDQHVQDHGEFFANCTKIAYLYETGEIGSGDDILESLTDWFAFHGEAEDLRFAQFLQKQGRTRAA